MWDTNGPLCLWHSFNVHLVSFLFHFVVVGLVLLLLVLSVLVLWLRSGVLGGSVAVFLFLTIDSCHFVLQVLCNGSYNIFFLKKSKSSADLYTRRVCLVVDQAYLVDYSGRRDVPAHS